jgi:hypothetical protein
VSDSIPRPRVQPEAAAVETYASRLAAALACLDQVAIRLRWLAADASLPRKLKYTLWEMSLQADAALGSAPPAAVSPDDDDDGVDLNGPPGRTMRPGADEANLS